MSEPEDFGLDELEMARLDAVLAKADALNTRVKLTFGDEMQEIDERTKQLREQVAKRLGAPVDLFEIDLQGKRLIYRRPEDKKPPAPSDKAQRTGRFNGRV